MGPHTRPTSHWVDNSFITHTGPASHYVEAGYSRLTTALWSHTLDQYQHCNTHTVYRTEEGEGIGHHGQCLRHSIQSHKIVKI